VSNGADRRRFLLWKTLGTLLERLPVTFAVRVAEIFGWSVAWRSTPTRDTVRQNIRQIVEHGTDARIDDRVLSRWVRRSYASYARYWAEGATLPGATPALIGSRIKFIEGEDHLRQAMERGKGVIVALPHIGSWDWGGAVVAQIGFPMTAVAERLEPPELFEWFVTKRESIGLLIEPLDAGAGKRLVRTLRSGGLVGLLCDRDLMGDGIEVTLLDRRARMPAGPATLALRTEATLLTGVIYSGPGDQHSIYISAPLSTAREGRLRDDVNRVSQAIADELSGFIRRSPEQWHVFSDPFSQDASTP